MTPVLTLPASRAHRRFLGILASGQETWDCAPQEGIILAAHLRPVVLQHLATTGIPRGGPILGYRSGDQFTATHLLSAMTPGLSGVRDPLAVDASYLLGAIDALRQFTGQPTDWIGHWYMATDGLATDELTDQLVWRRARRLALVGPCNALLTIGHGEGQPVMHAYVAQEGEMSPLPVKWAAREEG